MAVEPPSPATLSRAAADSEGGPAGPGARRRARPRLTRRASLRQSLVLELRASTQASGGPVATAAAAVATSLWHGEPGPSAGAKIKKTRDSGSVSDSETISHLRVRASESDDDDHQISDIGGPGPDRRGVAGNSAARAGAMAGGTKINSRYVQKTTICINETDAI